MRLLVIVTAFLAISAITAMRFEDRRQPGLKEQQYQRNDLEIDALLEQLRWAENRVTFVFTNIPGGEVFSFSAPMIKLIKLGQCSKAKLERELDGPIRREAALILGLIGDKATIDELINHYPTEPFPVRVRSEVFVDYACFSFGLTYLTCKKLDRTREGIIRSQSNKISWQEWWNANKIGFLIPSVKPTDSWFPKYPNAIVDDQNILRK